MKFASAVLRRNVSAPNALWKLRSDSASLAASASTSWLPGTYSHGMPSFASVALIAGYSDGLSLAMSPREMPSFACCFPSSGSTMSRR